MLGVLNVAKPVGLTSHDVVARLRRLLGIRRIGHSGTLDPLADGVLLLCVGQATRLVEYLNELPKSYRARLQFGSVSDTQDATGAVLSEADASAITRQQLAAGLAPFRGEIEQVPPMYSALKVGGRPLYERARRGEVIERAPRRVKVYSLELAAFDPGPSAEATLEIACSSGTYVRTLCHDLGAVLGPGAIMTALTRTAIGRFRLENAQTPDELGLRRAAGAALPWISPAEAVAHLASLQVDAAGAAALRQGKRLKLEGGAAGRVRLVDLDGALVAIGRVEAAAGLVSVAPEKVFHETDDPD